jgi:hypothetical protein
VASHAESVGAHCAQSGFLVNPAQEEFIVFRKTALLPALLLCACASGSPPPNILSIEPQEVVRGEPATISVKLDALPPVRIDYGKRTATLLATLRIDGQEASIDRLEQDGTLVVTLPPNLSEGTHDIRLSLEDEGEAVSEQGLTVLPPPPMLTIKNGDSEDRSVGITAIRIDPIADQFLGVPFVITLRVEGPSAALFAGQVQLTTNKGHINPNLSQPFQKGVREEQVILDQPGNVVLTVRAGDKLIATSNTFKVLPR